MNTSSPGSAHSDAQVRDTQAKELFGTKKTSVINLDDTPTGDESSDLEITAVRVAPGAKRQQLPATASRPAASALNAKKGGANMVKGSNPTSQSSTVNTTAPKPKQNTSCEPRPMPLVKRPAGTLENPKPKKIKTEDSPHLSQSLGRSSTSFPRVPPPVLASSSPIDNATPNFHAPTTTDIPAPSQISAPSQPPSNLPPAPEWKPASWTASHYAKMAETLYRVFPLRDFALSIGKDPREVAEVFSGVFTIPLQQHAPSISPSTNTTTTTTQSDPVSGGGEVEGEGEGTRRMHAFKRVERELRALHEREDREYKLSMRAAVMSELGKELEELAKEKVWAQVKKEGWVKIERAKEMISEHEVLVKEERDKAKETTGGPGGRAKAKVLSVAEAMTNMLGASEELNKARKAEERKNKSRKREEREGGEGAEKKVGRPRKGKDKDEHGHGNGKGGKGSGM
ncbi:hypothetical protein MMC10_000525 [Thelotrema lepadinum]|nr:hypothetical protein [Thelotrema lepadinum]